MRINLGRKVYLVVVRIGNPSKRTRRYAFYSERQLKSFVKEASKLEGVRCDLKIETPTFLGTARQNYTRLFDDVCDLRDIL